MKYALAALLIAASAPATAAPRDPGTFLLNVQGGVITCRQAHAPSELAFCAGAERPARDPHRFDCRRAEVSTEYRFCGLPYPTRSR